MIRLLPVVLLCYSYVVVAQSGRFYETESKRLVKALHDRHVQPRPIDDAFSQVNFDNLLLELDPDAMYFTAQDIQSLAPFKTRIDDELNGSSPWTYLTKVTALYKQSLVRYKQGITELSKIPVDFNNELPFKADTTFESSPEKLKAKWALEFRLDAFERLYSRSLKKTGLPEKDFLAQNEKLVRDQTARVMLRSAEKHLAKPTGVEDFVATEFMNGITHSFDPHSAYFSPQKIKEFIASLSSNGAYFGFGLDENEEGEVYITNLKPGGPAWNSGQIFEGDVLEEIQFESEPAVELYGFSVEDVVEVIDESSKDAMSLVVRNAEGVSRTVSLRKAVDEAEENVVTSFILNGKQKVGLISLPSFYSSWNESDLARCANDVAREVVKLKRENVEGIIFDIRFNGGGLMHEAVAMAGIFVDAGPMVATRNRAGEIQTVKDLNRGTIYDGPLVVLINGASASASELFAAALQDYHRAIIVGGTTYGKGTAQQILPTATVAGGVGKKTLKGVAPKPEDTGYASITTERFYRVTGKTNQFVGVVPDITIPDILTSMDIGERFVPGALTPDEIQKKIYYQPLPALPIDSLARMSQRREKANPGFAEIEKYGEWISKLSMEEGSAARARWADYKKDRTKDLEFISASKDKTLVQKSSFKAVRTPNSIAAGPPDEYETAYNNRWVTRLEQDLFLEEGFNIICDYIKLVGKK